MGYAGGGLPEPEYHHLGDHSEAIEIGFDPEKISYERLLAEFWSAHSPDASEWSRQYRNAIFVHSDAQREAAERTRRQQQRVLGRPITTAIEEAGLFWQAEDYHQKYRLRSRDVLFAEVRAAYPDVDDLVLSTLAARLNAWSAGWGEEADVDRELDRLGLSPVGRAAVAKLASGLK